MNLNVSQKIIYSEVVIAALVLTTLFPYLLAIMDFAPLQLFHFVIITLFVLMPLGFASLFSFTVKWEYRPIEMLAFYLDRRLNPPDDIMAASRVRALNLPLVHSASVLIRYEIICLLSSCYMGIAGGLPLRETLRLSIYSCIGVSIYPIFSFFLTERFLYPVRQLLAERTESVRVDESHVYTINIHTRILSILLAMVIVPLIALGALVYHRISADLANHVSNDALIQPILWELSNLIFLVISAALLLSIGIAILLSRSISNPLGHLVEVIRQLERGHLRSRSNLISNDEIGVVSQSFDTMASKLERSSVELQEMNRTLEFRVADKTENLTRAYEHLQVSNRDLENANRELEEANRRLMEIDKLKSDFISVVSHELRTPLTSIKAFTELILMKPRISPLKKTRMLTIINNEAERLARLINDILDLNRIESGELSWQVEAVSINDVVKTSIANMQTLAENKNISLSSHTEPAIPTLTGDRDRLIQVVTNIISNSIKYTPSGGRISISVNQTKGPQTLIKVSIADTGIGIPAEDLEVIFEKFRRSGDILTSTIEGTGLGLAISRQIVEHHGGRIWAESTLGMGSTFTFTLPLTRGAPYMAGENSVSAEAPGR